MHFFYLLVNYDPVLTETTLIFCSFEFRLRITLSPGGDLTLTSRIRNIDSKPFSFTFAYHTYFSVSDIRYYSLVPD